MNDRSGRPDDAPESPRSGLTFPVVGLGASAGGLAALLKCFENLPAEPDMAFVVILHLSPKHESNAAAILQKATRMPVRQVQSPTAIERNHVYVIPPTHSLSMYDGHLGLSTAQKEDGRPIAIDLFFRTLADAHADRAIGVVLSGTGSDGSTGLARIKEKGGIVIAQSPADAEYSAMPESAIATGKVDIVLPVADIPQKLIELWRNARAIELPAPEGTLLAVTPAGSTQASETALLGIMELLYALTGHDFRHYKRATVLRRLERRLQVNRLVNLPAYLEFMKGHPPEAAALLSDMLIGVTNFFRDRESFEALERDILPQLFGSEFGNAQLRAWVAGCSTGEEAYSLAILLSEAAARAGQQRDLQVFASDIDTASLATARQGTYRETIVADVPPNFIRTYFEKIRSTYRIIEGVRRKILFSPHNLLCDPPYSRLDLVSCRNLLIYLDREVQADILRMFHFALRPGGYLFLGSSETADAAPSLFQPVDKKHRIYRSMPSVRRFSSVAGSPIVGLTHSLAKPALAQAVEIAKPPALGELLQRLIFEEHAPPSLIVDADLEILQLSPGAGRFLRFVEGDPAHRLLAVVRPELRAELRLALHEAASANTLVDGQPVKLTDGSGALVRVAARPITRADWPAHLTLVTFTELAESVDGSVTAAAARSDDPVARQLEQELNRKEELLRATVEQFSRSGDELRASNEELQAINEELRSASEELETSKEELQSTNEELTFVNAELKAKVEETAQVNDDLQNLLRATEIATVFVDPEMRIKRFTPAAASIFNLIESDVGRSLFDITHKLDYGHLADDAAATFATLRMVEREVRSSDGRWFLGRLLPYRTSEDRIGGAVLTFVDISSRVLAESRMHLGEERMQLVVQSVPEFAILTTDAEGVITSWSVGAEALFGYSEAESLGQPLNMIFTPEDIAAGQPAEEMRQAAEFGRAPCERWHLRQDGSRFFASGVLTRLTLGGLQGFAKIARDATATHRREGDSVAAMQAARVSESMKDEFLAVLSHELKHPLNLIHVNAQLLLSLPETRPIASVRKAGETIERSVAAQARIIDDLLDLSRTKSGKLRLETAPLDLGQAIEPSLIWAASKAKEKGLEFVYEKPPEALIVEADAIRVEQIAMNLLGNALKFTDPGGRIAVRLSCECADAVLEIADNGRGIAPAFLPHVFGMFEQEEVLTSRREGGLGIGLGLARELVLLHHGQISVFSPGTGLGATFTVRLPLQEQSDFSPLEEPAEEPSPLAGLKLLLVDDDVDAIETFAILLELQGAHVTTAASGAEALTICTTAAFDLIVSDIGMPNMDGSQLMANLRRRRETQHVPAIALTGYGRPQDVQEALAAGFSAHLTKPVDLLRLRQLARQLTRAD